jgi:hypothetical protein
MAIAVRQLPRTSSDNTLLMALQKTEAKIDFGFSIWISTHSLVHRDGADDDSHYCSAYWNNHLCYICIISIVLK